MQTSKSLIRGLTLLLVFTLTACSNLSATPTLAPVTDLIPPTQTLTIAPAPTNTAEPTVATLPTATETTLPTATTEALASPADVSVSSGSNVTFSLTKNTNCRSGPGTVYSLITTIQSGVNIRVIGRLAHDFAYYYVEDPADPTIQCWIYATGVPLQGDRNLLPILQPLPTPMPDSGMDFSVTYSNIMKCGDDYAFSFLVKNTNKMVWQSIRVYIVDVKTNVSAIYTNNRFEEYLNCHLDNIKGGDLAEGEKAFITPYDPGHFDYSPYGGTFLLRVTLCSEKSLAGTCLTREIKVNP